MISYAAAMPMPRGTSRVSLFCRDNRSCSSLATSSIMTVIRCTSVEQNHFQFSPGAKPTSPSAGKCSKTGRRICSSRENRSWCAISKNKLGRIKLQLREQGPPLRTQHTWRKVVDLERNNGGIVTCWQATANRQNEPFHSYELYLLASAIDLV